MKKFLLSASVAVIFTVYSIHLKPAKGVNGPTALVQAPSIVRTRRFEDDGNFVVSPAPIVTSTPPPVASTNVSSGYKNGTYIGSVADAFYGNVQVEVTISGGQITDVQFLQYPNDRQTSIDINSQAMPYLKQEAIQAQSAQVAGVSGATATSQAFIESLGMALKKAL